MVREYIRNQEKQDVDREPLKWEFNAPWALTLTLLG